MGHGIIAWIIIGALAGWITGKLMKGSGFGFLMDMVIGLIGAFIGGFHLVPPGPRRSGRPWPDHEHRDRRCWRGDSHVSDSPGHREQERNDSVVSARYPNGCARSEVEELAQPFSFVIG